MWDKKGEDISFNWFYKLKERLLKEQQEAEFSGERESAEALAALSDEELVKYASARANKCNSIGNISVGNPDKEKVEIIQKALAAAGANITDPAGTFGPTTLIATIAAQKQTGIRTDGCVGPETIEALKIPLKMDHAATANVKINPNDPNQPPVTRIGDKSDTPSSVVKVRTAWGSGAKLDPVLAALVSRIQKDAAADGVPGVYPKGKIFMVAGPNSGLRSLEKQEAFWQKALKKYGSAKKARKWVAMPISQGGHGSPHTTGRAIDFFLGMAPGSKNNEALKSTPAYRWLVANAHKYGLSQYKGEAWHWELNKANRNYFAKFMSQQQSKKDA